MDPWVGKMTCLNWVCLTFTELPLIRIFSAALRLIWAPLIKKNPAHNVTYRTRKKQNTYKIKHQIQTILRSILWSTIVHLQTSRTAIGCFDLLYKHIWHENIWTKRQHITVDWISCSSYWAISAIEILESNLFIPSVSMSTVWPSTTFIRDAVEFVVECVYVLVNHRWSWNCANPRCCWNVRCELMKHADCF